MPHKQFFIDNLWRWKCGIEEKSECPQKIYKLSDLQESEWSPLFEKLMRNSLIIGAYRYGKLNSKHKPQYDRMRAIKERADIFIETGNQDYLVDIANFALLEFEEGRHPKAHIKVLLEHDFHVKKLK